MRPDIVLRNAAIVAVWNQGRLTMTELSRTFQIPRNSIAHILTEARADGWHVLGGMVRAGTKGPDPINRADGGQTSETTPNPTL